MNRRSLLILLCLLLLTAAALFPGTREHNLEVVHQHEQWAPETPEASGFQADGSLRTHLPILILHTDGAEIPGLVRGDSRVLTCRYDLITGDVNASDGEPSLQGDCHLTIRGNSSRDYPKKQYALKTVDAQGLAADVPLLDMPAESSWVLNGSYIDHSMVRNYMVYNLAGEIMDYAPRARLCEVFLTDASGKLQYEGVYTLCEQIKLSPRRLDLEKLHPGHPETSFLMQMNSYIDNVRIWHLKPDGILTYSFDLEYPAMDQLTEESYHYIETQLLIFEKSLYDAVKFRSWDTFHNYVDLDSFVDYYLINEFFQNLDAGTRSTYLYQNLGGKISIGPVWDFDGAFNNFSDVENRYDYMKVKSTFYYRALFQDPEFVARCIRRYKELRKTVLSEETLLKYLDGCEAYLAGPAQRNCRRWYGGNETLWREDLEYMREFVRRRGAWMDENFEALCAIIE